MNLAKDLKKEIEDLKSELKKAEQTLENSPQELDIKQPKSKKITHHK